MSFGMRRDVHRKYSSLAMPPLRVLMAQRRVEIWQHWFILAAFMPAVAMVDGLHPAAVSRLKIDFRRVICERRAVFMPRTTPLFRWLVVAFIVGLSGCSKSAEPGAVDKPAQTTANVETAAHKTRSSCQRLPARRKLWKRWPSSSKRTLAPK